MIKSERANVVREILDKAYPEVPIPLDHKNNFTLLIAAFISTVYR